MFTTYHHLRRDQAHQIEIAGIGKARSAVDYTQAAGGDSVGADVDCCTSNEAGQRYSPGYADSYETEVDA